MASVLTYAEAVRLLGGVPKPDEDIPPTDVLGWFSEASELVRQNETLISTLAERRHTLSGARRAESLAAAHTVIMVSAFFASLAEVRLPVELTNGEELSPGQVEGIGDFAEQIRSAGELVPSRTRIPESFEADLRRYYLGLADRLHRFIRGLARWERLPVPQRNRITRQLTDTADRALDRYLEALLRLAADFPEVAAWTRSGDHRATPDVPIGRVPGIWRERLVSAYRADLQRPMIDSGGRPDGVHFPSVEDAYVTPRFRVAEVTRGARIGDESWWADRPIRDDLQQFLAAYLTTPNAVHAPLLILGDPGAGKTMLTRILAGRLPEPDFMTIRVPLREVPAEADVVEQIEYAIQAAIGQRVAWPDLVESAQGALPVVLLDGFDELLQATRVHQSDYLMRLGAFQRREGAIGRPTAVIVTSRTVAADQVRPPEEAVAVRLEPFDDSRVARWLEVWNRTNAHLSPEAVLAYGELATQPLLLLLLAIHLSSGEEMGADRYETLLNAFVQREVGKLQAGLSDRDLSSAAEQTTVSLSIAAFAMFNRNRQWATDYEIDGDLNVLGFNGRQQESVAGFRSPLRRGELLIGRFFFVHQAPPVPDDASGRTYEFLHATFGEYLVARMTWEVLRSMSEQAVTPRFALDSPDDDLLRSLLSYQPLSLRSSIPSFLANIAGLAGGRRPVRALLLELFRRVDHAAPPTRFHYEPVPLGVPARYATYAANLLLLLLCTGIVQATDLYPDHPDPLEAWHSQTLLWRSQLSAEGWHSLVGTVTVERVRDGARRDLRLTLGTGPIWRRGENHFEYRFDTAAGALMEVWTDPSPETYRAAMLAADPAQDDYETYWALLIAQLPTGNGVTPDLAAEILDAYLDGPGHTRISTAAADSVLRCVLAYLGRDSAADSRLARAGNAVLPLAFEAADPILAVDTLVRLHEKGLLAYTPPVLQDENGRALLLRRIAVARPDLEPRLQAVVAGR